MTTDRDNPAMQALCVLDSSVLFDLRHGAIIDYLPRLPYRFAIPDAVLAELDPPLRSAIRNLGLETAGLRGQTIPEVFELRPAYPQLSVADLFAFLVARERGALLLTGDSRLRRLAESRGLTVHGTLWVLDELSAKQVLSAPELLAAMERILEAGARLPAQECERRRDRWQ